MRIRIENLVMRPNVPAGMNPLVLMSLAYAHRSTAEDHGPPVTVEPVDGTGFYRVVDGRHRFLSCVVAGRPDVECELESSDA